MPFALRIEQAGFIFPAREIQKYKWRIERTLERIDPT